MVDVSFTQALRAELDAVIARYDAMVQSQRAALASSHEHQLQSLQSEVASLIRQRDQLEGRVNEAVQNLAKAEAKVEQRDAEIALLHEKVEKERRRTNEASSRAAESLAEARLKIGELSNELDLVAEESRVFEEVFAGEVAFVEACLPIANTPLSEAVREAAGIDIELAPSVYGNLKRERLDVLLTRAVRERGRSTVDRPLSVEERIALQHMADAAGCELILPVLGVRYDADEMDKVTTASDPSEEGNVLACLMPGLRLAETEGALVFPKVKVAVG